MERVFIHEIQTWLRLLQTHRRGPPAQRSVLVRSRSGSHHQVHVGLQRKNLFGRPGIRLQHTLHRRLEKRCRTHIPGLLGHRIRLPAFPWSPERRAKALWRKRHAISALARGVRGRDARRRTRDPRHRQHNRKTDIRSLFHPLLPPRSQRTHRDRTGMDFKSQHSSSPGAPQGPSLLHIGGYGKFDCQCVFGKEAAERSVGVWEGGRYVDGGAVSLRKE